MNKTHSYARFLKATDGIFRRNPILSMGLALPFAVAATSSLQSAVALSITTLITLIPVCLLMPFIMKLIPGAFQWLDYPLCALLAAFFVLPTRLITGAISAALMDSVGIYFSLLCVSSLLFAARDMTRQEESWAKALWILIRLWLGTALVLVLLGCVREVLGYGTLWGKPLTWMKVRFSGVMVSGMGFILLGFMAALGKKLHRSILFVQLWARYHGDSFRGKMISIAEKVKAAADEEEPAEKTKKIPKEVPADSLPVEESTEEIKGKEQE